MQVSLIVCAVFALHNLIAFARTGLDKRAAGRGGRRMPEKTIVLLALAGAGPGVLAAFYLFRHKTKHRSLLAAAWIGAVLSSVALVLLCILCGRLFPG